MKLISYCNKVIEYSFYALFFLVPLAFAGNTSELFELNKMWLTFGFTTVIGTAWLTKMVIQKQFSVQRTPIDIILLLFLLSQIISSIFSLDQHVSWMGYYSRFNGGLLSTICYIILYYAFVTNFNSYDKEKRKLDGLQFTFIAIIFIIIATAENLFTSGFSSSSLLAFIFSLSFFIGAWFLRRSTVINVLLISLFSGIVVSIWGFPSHFGADPTCLVFRGSFDTSCWTNAFQPTIRAFSTLGQPEWLAAYMAFLLPVSMAYMLKNKDKINVSISFLVLTIFFYLLEIFSSTRAGFLAFWLVNIIFWSAIFYKKLFPTKYFLKMLIITNVTFLLCTFLFNSPLGSLSSYTLPELTQSLAPAKTPAPTRVPSASNASSSDTTTYSDLESITDSGKIRLLVWQGALKAWENNPIFGTGVETYAFAYYKYKSPQHNLTSEWDYLYNKAHNEYLNYLATTGIFGLGTYLGFIGFLFLITAKWYFNKSGKINNQTYYEASAKSTPTTLLVIGLITGYISILITDFFGFSVVIINLYIFLVPAFVFILLGLLNPDRKISFPKTLIASQDSQQNSVLNTLQWTSIVVFSCLACWILFTLIWYRQADIAYALGFNYDQVGDFQQAYPQLSQAVQMEPHEPVYEDELSINLAALSAGLYTEKNPTQGSVLAKNAIALSDDVVAHHPNNVVYWKDRVRLFYTLSASDTNDSSAYLQQAIQAINTAKNLAPTDAKIAYNQGVLYGQAGDLPNAIQMLNNAVQLKVDYTDAYIALGLFYHESALDKNGKVINPAMQQKALDTYEFILKNLDPSNTNVKKSLEEWRTSQ